MLVILALTFTAQHFAMMTDGLQLMSQDLPWRRNKATFDKAFPQQVDSIVVVVDGATPELAERGAAELTAWASAQSKLFRSVRRPDSGPPFERNGLLFLPAAEVAATMDQLIAAEPFLGPLAADPSLRGIMESLSTTLEGVRHGEAKLEDLGRALTALADSLERVVDGKPAFFSWRTLISGKPADSRETRRVILIQPYLDDAVLMPGKPASDAIRRAAHDLHLDPSDGVRVRLTGSVALADEEFSTLTERAGTMTAAMTFAVLSMLWLAVRTARIIACILVTTLAGLVLTTAMGLLVVGRFNLISVAFIPLYVGLGIDFAIQFSVRYRAEHVVDRDARTALIATGSAVGGSLALAAAAMAVGFFAFLPTAYVGASELGVIAGIGMAIAFLLSVSLLPALLQLGDPRGQPSPGGLSTLAPLGIYLLKRRKSVLAVGAVAALVCLALLPRIRFDFNPLHLRSSKVESMATLIDLMSDPDRTPNNIDVLAPNLRAAGQLAERFSREPEVARAITLLSFIPSQQSEKLALISDASSLLDLVLNPNEIRTAPSEPELVHSLARAAEALRQTAGEGETPAATDARRLATLLDRLADGAPALRARASKTLVTPLLTLLGQLRSTMQAEPVTLENLPPELVRDWVAADGRAKIQVFPTGDSNNNENLERFAKAVRRIAPDATGTPITTQEAARTIVNAFIEAGLWSFLAITGLLGVVLRRVRDVTLTIVPILLAGFLTLGSCVLIGQSLDFANIIALPLLFGIGVAFNIYFVVAWRAGETNLLRSSLARAVVFSALTTATAFGSLCLSTHPGTVGLGRLLMMSLGWTLVTALLFEPALLGPPRP